MVHNLHAVSIAFRGRLLNEEMLRLVVFLRLRLTPLHHHNAGTIQDGGGIRTHKLGRGIQSKFSLYEMMEFDGIAPAAKPVRLRTKDEPQQ